MIDLLDLLSLCTRNS